MKKERKEEEIEVKEEGGNNKEKRMEGRNDGS